jgi:uncharacterized Zn-finger protein
LSSSNLDPTLISTQQTDQYPEVASQGSSNYFLPISGASTAAGIFPSSQALNTAPSTNSLNPQGSVNQASASTPSPTNRHHCDRCPSTFVRSSDLRRHYRKHFTSQIVYGCFVNNCPRNGLRGFTRRDKLADHQRKIHGL